MLFHACCCEPGCLLFQDGFDRANSTFIGGNWTEDSGDAEINTNRLRTAVLGAGRTIANYIHTSEQMVVDVNVLFDSSSIAIERAGVVINYLNSNNFLYVQIEATFNAFAGTIRTRLQFFRRSGGVDTQLGSTRTIDGSNGIANHQLRVCYDGTYLRALGFTEPATKIDGGFRSGVYSNSTSAVYFDDFRMSRFSAQCPNCGIHCTRCGEDATESYVIDFGSGGWVDAGTGDNACDYCDQIVGEFVVATTIRGVPYACWFGPDTIIEPPVQCVWIYERSRNPCVVSQICWFVCITLRAVPLTTGAGFIWEVHVAVCSVTSTPLASHNQAIYQSALVTDCSATMSLSKTFESVSFCTGSLPATIELRAIP